jgi:hypothetical protein
MTSPSPARFFAAMRLHPPYALAILAIIVGIGVWTTTVSPAEIDSGLGMVLFVQMFLASSGFLVRARRGHFDPLLVGGGDRVKTMAWHWIVSIAPGVAAWICLAGAGYILGSPDASSAFMGGRAAALFIVSALAWSAGFALPRSAAGVVWAAVLLALLVRGTDLLAPISAAPGSIVVTLRHAVTLLVCPFLLIGNHVLVTPGAICAAALFSSVFLLAVWRLSGGLDIYLVDRA